jgi:acetylglutamate synthase
MGATVTSQNFNESPSKFNNPSVYQVYEERKLTGTGQYDLTYTRSEFDIEEDLEEIVEAKEDK